MTKLTLKKKKIKKEKADNADLLTRCGFGPGGEGVWRGSSSDELEFLN